MADKDEKKVDDGNAASGAERPVIDYSIYNKRTTEYEFFGPIGALFVTIFTPAVFYALFFFCNEHGCPPKWAYSITFDDVKSLATWKFVWSILDWQAFKVTLQWFGWCIGLWYLLPGKQIEGTLLRDGTRLKYKQNAFWSLLLTLFVTFSRIWDKSPWNLVWVYDHFLGLMTSSLIISTTIAIWSYYNSFSEPQLLAEGGNSGNPIYDFFIGRALNPRWDEFDVKVFCELRPGLIGWMILNICMACRQWAAIGQNRITDSMVLVLVFQGWYVFDALWNEAAVLTTMDVTTDGFGFMLSFGDLAWLPFTYCLQARYLASHPLDLGAINSTIIIAIQLIGYWIFRGANSEKDAFRRDPDAERFKNHTYIKTETGTRLLTSGWWGKSRHMNYLGDWIMAWAWCLPTGFSTPIPYFYVVYFAVLLIHRERRDDEKCAKKYGKDWEKYKKMVPYRIIPYVY